MPGFKIEMVMAKKTTAVTASMMKVSFVMYSHISCRPFATILQQMEAARR